MLNEAEQAALLAACSAEAPTGLRNRALVLLFLNTGLRVSEALSLVPADIDWAGGRLTVRRGKGGRSRVLWLGPGDLRVGERWLAFRPSGAERLFCTMQGRPLHDRYVRNFVRRAGQRAGLTRDVHPHLLRHTFATDLLHSTGNIRLVQKALGHASLTTTMLYTHIVDEQLEAALKGLRRSAEGGARHNF